MSAARPASPKTELATFDNLLAVFWPIAALTCAPKPTSAAGDAAGALACDHESVDEAEDGAGLRERSGRPGVFPVSLRVASQSTLHGPQKSRLPSVKRAAEGSACEQLAPEHARCSTAWVFSQAAC